MLRDARRNLIYFIMITLLCGWLGVLVDLILTEQPAGYSLGTGVWLALPFLCAVIFRIREKSWKSFGLSINIGKGWRGYLTAFFIYPVITLMTVLLAVCFGCAETAVVSWADLLSAAAGSFAAVFIKNIFEEFAWRGYLTPRLLERGLNDWWVYGISGLVWGLWHTAYYMVFLDDQYFVSSSRSAVFMAAVLITVTSSVLFAEVYRMTQSVWACVVLHSVYNTIPTVLAAAGFVMEDGGWGQMVFDPTIGFVSMIAATGAGLVLRRRRMATDSV